MNLRKIALAFSVFGCTMYANVTSALGVDERENWKSWQPVGQAQLKVLFFDIYQSTLLSPDGLYRRSEDITPHPLALSIHYQRDISQKQLIDATDEQWEILGYSASDRSTWIRQLESIFPDIEQGQKLAYVTDGKVGHFYYDRYGQFVPIGAVDNETLNDAFLAIWLSPETQYPNLRRRLIGEKQ